MGNNTTPRRVSAPFANAMDNLKIQRIKNGIDRRTISDARLTDGMLSTPGFTDVLKKLAIRPGRI